MKISIIIPVLNEENNIGHLLEKLLPAEQNGHEILVVDGGSQDQTISICKRLGVNVFTSACGRAEQMQAGVRMAHGDVFWFLHADTDLLYSVNDYLDDIRSVTSAGWGRFNIALSNDKFIYKVIGYAINLRSRISGIATGDQGIFINRELFQYIGGFRQQPLMEDIQISRDLLRRGRPAVIKRILMTSARRWERRGVLRTILLMWWLRLLYFMGVSPVTLRQYYD
jgi:rSAM/selenodomain-associated transferase 2